LIITPSSWDANIVPRWQQPQLQQQVCHDQQAFDSVRRSSLLLVAVYTAWVSGYDSNTNDLLTVGDAVDSSYVNTMTSATFAAADSTSSKVPEWWRL
jgi:hypothetical protein